MSQAMKFKVELASHCIDVANEFYEKCGRVTTLNPNDILVFGYISDELVGLVRLCFEHGHYVLRTMQIHDSLQGKGFGRQLLEKFQKMLNEQGIGEVYCMPYTHLEYFYGLIGFKKLLVTEAPSFLQQRVQDFDLKHPDKSVILMKRSI